MRKAFLNLAVLGLTCLTGFSAHLVWSRGQLLSSGTRTVSAEQSREEEWHRLYEAAGMTGNSEVMKEVRDRLQCASSEGLPEAWPIDRNGRTWCQQKDGTIHELNSRSEYGRFERRVTATHSTWCLENLAFVRSVVQPQIARAYVYRHEWPGVK
jgi:cell division protein FtsL